MAGKGVVSLEGRREGLDLYEYRSGFREAFLAFTVPHTVRSMGLVASVGQRGARQPARVACNYKIQCVDPYRR